MVRSHYNVGRPKSIRICTENKMEVKKIKWVMEKDLPSEEKEN